MEHGVGLKNQVKYELVRLMSRQGCGRLGSVTQGRYEQHLKNLPVGLNRQEKIPRATQGWEMRAGTENQCGFALISSPGDRWRGWICQGRAKQRCWACRQGQGCLGMYLAASRIHMVKCIFPASLLPSLALFPWLSSLGRNPSSPQAGKTPGTMLIVSITGQEKAEQPSATPACSTTRTQPKLPGSFQLFPTGSFKMPRKSQRLLQLAQNHQPCQMV